MLSDGRETAGTPSDRDLVANVCAGQSEAVTTLLVERLGPTVLYLSRKFRYEELLSDLFLHLQEHDWSRLRSWSGAGSLDAWISQVCIRLCFTRLRREKRFVQVEDGLLEQAPDGRPNIQDELIAACDRERVLHAIETLEGPRDRLVLRMLCLENRSPDLAAREIGISREHLYVLKGRAIARLKKKLVEGQHA